MKLYPKARPVRIKLNVGGEEHSSLDSLRANFNVEEVLKLYKSGGLQNWLRQINRLDILERMDKIHNTDSSIEKYRKCIMIFFDCPDVEEYLKRSVVNNSHWSIEEILMKWYDTYPSSFKFLLSSISSERDVKYDYSETSLKSEEKMIPLIEYHLSVKVARTINEKARRCKDNLTQRYISKYIYGRIKPTLEGIRIIRSNAYVNTNIANDISRNEESDREGSLYNYERNYRRERLLEQLCKEWNIVSEKILGSSTDMTKLLYNLVGNNMVSDFRKELNHIVEQIVKDNDLLINDYSEKHQEKLKETIEFIKVASKDIVADNIDSKGFGIPIIEFRKTGKTFAITSDWFKMPKVLNSFDSAEDLTKLISRWGELCVQVYLYNFLLKDCSDSRSQMGIFYPFNIKLDRHIKTKNFLKEHKGKNGLWFILKAVHEYCNPVTMDCVTGLRKKIFQSALLIGILGNCESSERTKYLRELYQTNYVPASLLLGLHQPQNEVENAFMNLSDLERIPFIAEHILDF